MSSCTAWTRNILSSAGNRPATENIHPHLGRRLPAQFSAAAQGQCERLADTPEVRFKIIAPEKWRELFSGLGNVDFHSGLNDAELLAAYQSASCLLHTAENATANNALLEAMACGLPVIAERVGGIPEYVDAQSAALTALGNDEALAAAIRKLAQSPRASAQAWRVAARKRAETLCWPRVAGRMMEIYQTL